MSNQKKRIAVLGSTGSIGLNSLSVIDSLGDDYQLISAAAHRSWRQLAQQARAYDLQKVVITDVRYFDDLKKELTGADTEVLAGPEHLIDLAQDENVDTVIVSVVGAAGLPAVLAAARAGKSLAIANKESLVIAGGLVIPLARQSGAGVLPIDSEHSAILQALHAGKRQEVEKVIITCSGGPFRGASVAELAHVSLSEALNHPTWSMGPKISIDSATLMNKALEIIEARWLFDLSPDQIEVLIHPESIIHSLVEFCDGSAVAQLSRPDMRLPIQYALTYPDRLPAPTDRLNLHQIRQLRFEPPDLERFPALRLGYEVARMGGTAGAVLNGANEAAVEAFRGGKIGFNQIVELAEMSFQDHNFIEEPDLQQLMAADLWARRQVEERLAVLGRPAGL